MDRTRLIMQLEERLRTAGGFRKNATDEDIRELIEALSKFVEKTIENCYK